MRFLALSFHYRPYSGTCPGGSLSRARLPHRRLNLRAVPAPLSRARRGQQHRDYFLGSALLTFLGWETATLMGIVIGQRIPDVWALGYVGTTALLALTCTQLRDPISWVAAVVASCAHGAAFGLTLKLNVVAATAAAVAVGVRASQAPSLRAGDGR